MSYKVDCFSDPVELDLAVLVVGGDAAGVFEVAGEHEVGEGIFEQALDGLAERAGAVFGVIAFFGEVVLGGVGDDKLETLFF